MSDIVLNGITWNHSRGITPLLAAAQRFMELHPGVTIHWKKRSLQEFADYPLEKLTGQYDLLIIDHPWVGCAAATGSVLPLDKYLSPGYLQDQAHYSTGPSHGSYNYNSHQWALAIDAATPAASYRADLFEKHQASVPQTWQDVIALAKKGKVAVPGIAIDLLMNFYMFCIACGEQPFLDEQEVVSAGTGISALQAMNELYECVDKRLFSCNPIQVAELMTTTDDYWYCPFAYCYSNYSRTGYADHRLTYDDLVYFGNTNRFISTIGGTGLAVSAYSKHAQEAVAFAEWICSGECQSGLYVQHGGQPGHLRAWKDETANAITHDFFRRVLPAMERGYMRPRYNGYLSFQDRAGDPVRDYLLNKTEPAQVLKEINHIYKQSLVGEQPQLA